MEQQIVYPENFDVSKISISAPRSLDSGAKQSFLGYGGGKLIMQTGINMSLPFGLNTFESSTGTPEYSVDISFKNEDTRKEIKDFKNAMTALDNFVVSEGIRNSKAWFKADHKEDVVRAFYSSCIRYGKDKDGNNLDYPPTMKLKMKRVNGEIETKFFNLAGELYDSNIPLSELLPKGGSITCLIQCTGVWFAGGKFGLSWRLKQIVIHSRPEQFTKFAIRLDGEKTNAPEVSTGNGSSTSHDDDDDQNFSQMESEKGAGPSVVEQVMSANVVEPAPVPSKNSGGVFKRKKVLNG